MSYGKIAISSGHGFYVRGASSDMLDEVDEARRMVNALAEELDKRGAEVVIFHDNESKSQNENLDCIVNWHNDQTRDYDLSFHFNAYEQCDKPMGTEVLYVTQAQLADRMSAVIANAGGFIDRGPKKNTGLAFLNGTDKPAILIEVCFVDSVTDVETYDRNFHNIVDAIANLLSGKASGGGPSEPPVGSGRAIGKVSWFGGPDDEGVSPSEGLAFIYEVEDAPHLFLPYQPKGTTGLARRLNPHIHYIALRFDYDKHPKDTLLDKKALVRSLATGMALEAFPADWGPHEDTDRLADISPGLMTDLGLDTDDEVEVIFPVP
jgi:N-acetylmuramoyl-L-alanine amidase